MSRTVTAHLFQSLNGVVESPDQFQFDAFGPEEGELMDRTIGPVTDVVIGTTLWKEWSEYWPGKDDFGTFINPVRKHVVTSTLTGELPWNSTAIPGDPIAYVRELANNGEEGDISVVGGVETVRTLFVGGAIDTVTLTTHPAVTPQGRRLFDESVPLTRLELVDSTITSIGNAVLTYSLKA